MNAKEQPGDSKLHRIRMLRARQQREAGRGCLLALVLEGAALLAGLLWVLAVFLKLPRLSAAGLGAFVVFTLAALAAGVWLLIIGNLPGQRRLRRGDESARGGGDADSRPDKRVN